MPQHDMILANQAGAAFRADLNDALAALVTNNSGATEPATMYAYMLWADTTTGLLKVRNAANSAWITVGTLASVGLGLLSRAGGSMTGLLNLAASTDIASAATVDLTAATGNTTRITGTTATSAFTMNAGQWHMCIANGAWPLTYHATTNKLNTGGSDYTCEAGDRLLLHKDNSGIVQAMVVPTSGKPVGAIAMGSTTNLSGAFTDITSVPSGCNDVVLCVYQLSTNGTSLPLLILGDSGGFETSGYVGSNSLPYSGPAWLGNAFSNSFELSPAIAAASVFNGMIHLRRLGGTYWMAEWLLATSNSAVVASGAGAKQLSAELTQFRFIMANATDTFDNGSVTPHYMK